MRSPSPSRFTKDAVWRADFSRWNGTPSAAPGYTLLAPVPGDLPAFIHLVLAMAAQQDATGRVETIIVPDHITPEFETSLRRARTLFDVGPLRVVHVGWRGAAIRRFLGPGSSMPHFIQIYYGALAVRTSHVLLHDADLFVDDPVFFREHYRECVNGGFACLGVAPAWDEWLRENGAPHVVATWELMFETRWLRSFPPWQHRAHFAEWHGGRHGFDTMLCPQAHTPASRCGLNTRTEGLTHFNFVFGEYRTFERSQGPVYEDHKFLILLIRLLHDAYQGNGEKNKLEKLPSMRELARGLSTRPGRISYRFRGAPEAYREFRHKVERVVNGPFLSTEQRARVVEELRPFDVALSN